MTKELISPGAWDEFSWDEVFLEMKKHIQSDTHARIALRKLIKGGCDEKNILRDLYLFCGGEPKRLAMVRKMLANQKKKISEIADTLREAAVGITYADNFISEMGVECHFTPDSTKLVRYATLLEKLHDGVLPPKARFSGRDQHLAYLARTIKAITGRQHYKELSDLVIAVGNVYDPASHEHRGPGALRKLIKRTHVDSDAELRNLLDSSRA